MYNPELPCMPVLMCQAFCMALGMPNRSAIFSLFSQETCANLVAKLQVETADKQQLSNNLADLGIIKTELKAKLPSGCSNFISNWNHKLFDHSFSVLTFHEGWSAIFVSADLNRSRWLAASEVAFPI